MNESKLARQTTREPAERDEAAPKATELRQLEDLELALAAGGDTTVTWP